MLLCFVLFQYLDVEVSTRAPRSARDVSEPDGTQHQRWFPVRKCADDFCSPSDLAHDSFEWIIGPSPARLRFKKALVAVDLRIFRD